METERLIIRKAQCGDEADLYEIRNSEFVLKYNCMNKITKEQLGEQITKDAESDCVFHIVLKETGRVMGNIDLSADTLRYGVKALGLSYYLGEEYGSRGYMTEALREMIRYAFEERQAEVLSVRVFKDNTASRRLVEKLGFVSEGCIRSCVRGYDKELHDDMIYSMLKEEYNGDVR
jgi:RimJ/RimL family protein N-acetyltransferase